MTRTTSAMVSSSVISTSSTEARIVCVRSLRTSTCSDARHRGAQARQRCLDLVDGVDDVGARLLEDDEEHAALAVGPRCLLGVLRASDRVPDVAHAQGRAVAVGDDDVVPVVGVDELVVGVDGKAALVAVDAALGAVDGGDRQAACARPPATGPWRRAWPDRAGCGPRASARRRSRPGRRPMIWLICWASLVSALSSTSVSGMASETTDRIMIGAVRRVDLAVGRRRGKVARQLSARGVDRRLDVVGRRVDVAIEVELHDDGGEPEPARRGRLRYARDLRELALERLRHARCHDLWAGAGQRRGTPGWSGSRSAAAARRAGSERRRGRRTGRRPSAARSRPDT